MFLLIFRSKYIFPIHIVYFFLVSRSIAADHSTAVAAYQGAWRLVALFSLTELSGAPPHLRVRGTFPFVSCFVPSCPQPNTTKTSRGTFPFVSCSVPSFPQPNTTKTSKHYQKMDETARF
jgi:hypothetical protein